MLPNRSAMKFHISAVRMQYVGPPYMPLPAEHKWKKGSAELLVLSQLEDQPRHGYEISRLIDLRSGGSIHFQVASLYPLLYRLEKRNWIQVRWLEKANQRRGLTFGIVPALRSSRTSEGGIDHAIGEILAHRQGNSGSAKTARPWCTLGIPFVGMR
jgi:PadR family transcriptional regulator, regulatory protein PadR